MSSNFVPRGSYTLTCKNIQVTLTCSAARRDGSKVNASLDLTSVTSANVQNNDGQLVLVSGSAAATGFIPGGSYKDSCSNIIVMLTCRAQKVDQSWVDASLNLTRLAPASTDLANMNGQLVNMSDVLQAHAKLTEYFPEYQDDLIARKDAILKYATENVRPAAPDPARKTLASAAPASGLLTPCEMAGAVVAVDLVLLALGLVGIRVSNSERMTRALLQELGEDTLRGLAGKIHNFVQAVKDGRKLDAAKSAFSLLGGLYNAGMIKAALKEVYDEMSWWDWTKTGVIASAQLIAWFATDGAAFIAEAALVIMSSEQLVEDSAKAITACG